MRGHWLLLGLTACSVVGPGATTGIPADGGTPDVSMADASVPDEPPVLDDAARTALLALRYDASPPPADVSNRYADDAAARLFGRRLFFDTRLSGALRGRDNDGSSTTLGNRYDVGRVACSSCHVAESGFYDTRSPHAQISLASDWTRRRAPTLHEVAFQTMYNWDGRHDTAWSQAIGVMESNKEFNSSRLYIAHQIFDLHRTEYEAIFGPLPDLSDTASFPRVAPPRDECGEGTQPNCAGRPGDQDAFDGMSGASQQAVTTVMVNVAKAISAYLRQLRCGESRFDRWLDGDQTALTNSEQRGAALFVGRGDCVRCHSGPSMTDGAFHNVGLRPETVAVAFLDRDDRGAAEGVTAFLSDPLQSRGIYSDGVREGSPSQVDASLEGAFKTPTLRCVAQSPSFMHTGHLRTLKNVIDFFNRGGDPLGYPGTSEVHALGLTRAEVNDLVAFMESLTGDGPPAELRSAPP
jgi:cytochrome c peroxidase